MEFFKEFRNVEIYYRADLHAKYYANESKSIITSMNLHDYSMKNNIEVGVLFLHKRFWGKDNENDDGSYEYFEQLMADSEEILIKHPKEEKSFFGLFRSYGDSIVEVDESTKIHRSKSSDASQKIKRGYCIRTGEQIPFNINHPFSEKAFMSWAQFGNDRYPEKYCHYSGEPSNGETSKWKPVLLKYYSKAKEFEKE